jgi:uncharacterized protein (DUF983 family)
MGVKLLGRRTYKLKKKGSKPAPPRDVSAGKRKRCPTCGSERR